jgi:hypothetical protein
MVYYLILKGTNPVIVPVFAIWMDLEDTMLSEISQAPKDSAWSHLGVELKSLDLEAESRMVVSRAGVVGGRAGGREWGLGT